MALGVVGLVDPQDARLLGFPTRCSWPRWNVRGPIWKRPAPRSDLMILTPLRPLPLDSAGNLPPRMELLGPPAKGSS